MSQSATLPTREHPTDEKHAPEATAPFLTQRLEEQHLVERVERALRVTAAEQQLVKSVPAENANDEIQQSCDTAVHRHSHDGGQP